MLRPPRVTVLGTCRVYDPFKALAEREVVELRNAGVYGFVHSTKEALQQLGVMHGELTIPRYLARYVSTKVPRPRGAGLGFGALEPLGETDLLVVEISSLKEIRYLGVYLQINRLRNLLVGDDEELLSWWRRLYAEGSEAAEASFRDAPSPSVLNRLSWFERDLIARLEVDLQTSESVLADMAKISGYYAGPILWVSHFDTKGLRSGLELPLRQRLVASVERGARAMGHPFFNPRADVEAFGLTEALVDMAHYTPAFQAELEARFERMVPGLLSSRSAPSSVSTRSENALPSGSDGRGPAAALSA